MSSETILEIQNITKVFPGVKALDNVSICLKENETLAIVGENGAGKSTLMKVLSGNYEEYEGNIVVEGKKHTLHSIHEAEKAGIAMIYQELSIELDLSIAENLFLGMLPLNKMGLVDWKGIRNQAKEIMNTLGLDIDVEMTTRNLNASMQQLVCIGRALVRKPKILILDEPTAALTEKETNSLIERIDSLKKNGISCIYISHKLGEVFNIADRVVVMRDGKKVSEYEKKDIVPEKVIEDMIGRAVCSLYVCDHHALGEEILKVEHFRVGHPYAPNKNIIEDVNFTLRKGEILGLAGLVGSGRSELLRAVFGAMKDYSGSVTLDGKKITVRSPEDAIRQGIGFLTEERKNDGYVGTMNIKDNMTLAILNRIGPVGVINERLEKSLVDKYFSYLQIKAPGVDTNILTLSGGNQQKVILAKSLLTDMKVLLLDEPTRGIDIGAKSEIYRIMDELVKEGLSIIMVSSEIPELLAVCDRFVVLKGGKVAGVLDKEEADERNLLYMAAHSTAN